MTYNSQFHYENASRPEAPPEPSDKDIKHSVDDLMWCEDSAALSFDGWARSGADEYLLDLIGKHDDDPSILLRIFLTAWHCRDEKMNALVQPFIERLEEHAKAEVIKTLEKERGR